MKRSTQVNGRSFREWLLNICGYRIWPPTHNDPRIKGPPPRILTRRQWEALEMQQARESVGGYSAVYNGNAMGDKLNGRAEALYSSTGALKMG